MLSRCYIFYIVCIVLTANVFHFLNLENSMIIMSLFLSHKTRVKMLSRTDNYYRALWPFYFFIYETRCKRQKMETFRAAVFLFLPWAQHLFCEKIRWDGPWQQWKPIFGSFGISLSITNVSCGIHSWGK